MHKCSMNTVHDQWYHLNNHISWQIFIKICHRYQYAQVFIILLASINDKKSYFSVVLIIYNTSSIPHHGIHQSPLHAFYPRQVFQHCWKSRFPRKVYSLGINILAQFISWKYFENAISRAEAVVASNSNFFLNSILDIQILIFRELIIFRWYAGNWGTPLQFLGLGFYFGAHTFCFRVSLAFCLEPPWCRCSLQKCEDLCSEIWLFLIETFQEHT